ncbi:MAG TPA: flagellar hook protein FlgE [Bryobacteraceae bacterium]|jgi:flagellar hook protein FlgE|nr:flagellar hook protein FlgE [Bryobacteraceae bacterium]
MSFSTALSGLAANNTALDVVGNNLSNLNTTGFKSDAIQFKDIMGQTSGSTEIGAGVATSGTSKQFTQGSIQPTSGSLDAAIEGNGLFVVRNSAGSTLYTRAGSFKFDGTGTLVTSTGEKVQGWTAVNGVLSTTGNTGDISITAVASQPPTATTQMTLTANLDASAAVNGSFSTPLQVVDSLGVTHILTYTFTKTGSNAWKYDISIPGEDLTGGTPGTPTSLANGSLTFDSAGALTAPLPTAPVNVKTTTGLVSGAADLNMTWSLYSPSGVGLLTQFSQTSAASATSQDGILAAQLTGITLGDGGTLMATFSSGKQVSIAQVALAAIGNPDSLVSAGNNNFQLGTETLTPTIGLPQTGNRGQILGGSLESSNVDLAKEFTNLIIFQRGYQANAKVITTQDQLSQVLLNIKQ